MWRRKNKRKKKKKKEEEMYGWKKIKSNIVNQIWEILPQYFHNISQ